jgi:hypothetical protein
MMKKINVCSAIRKPHPYLVSFLILQGSSGQSNARDIVIAKSNPD